MPSSLSLPCPERRPPGGRRLPAACAAALLAVACSAPLPYRPSDTGLPAARTAFAARQLQGDALAAFLAASGRRLPDAGQAWDFESLALAAGWYSADVAVAQANWEAAIQQAALGAAAVAPVLDGQLEHHSMTDAGRPQPWTIALGFEFTLPSAERRKARQAQLDSRVQLARIALAQAFWDARRQLRAAWLQLIDSETALDWAQQQEALAGERLRRVQARVAGGESPASAARLAELASAEARAAALQARHQRAAAQAGLRVALGVPADGPDIAVDLPTLADPPSPADALAADAGASASAPGDDRPGSADAALPAGVAEALENRLDLRAAEARFEVADADLRWAVARQYPDLGVKPGYEWDQGDHRLRIGMSLPLPLPAAHRAEVTQAEAERAVRASEVRARQQAVLQDLSLARRALADAQQRAGAQARLLAQALGHAASVDAARRHGEVDALAVLEAQSQVLAYRQQWLQSQVQVLRHRAEVEDATQLPLDTLAVPGAAAAGLRPAATPPPDGGS